MTKSNMPSGTEITYLNMENAIAETIKETERVLRSSPAVVRRYTEHLAAARGKMIRALSLITCAQNADGLIHPNAVKFAAAIEILHLATLVHDDIIDDADLRRGIPTLHKKFGKRAAVICGDYLMAVALRLCTEIPNKQDYLNLEVPDYISKVCFGELYQYINNGNFDLSVYKYLKIISGKTAALFEAAFFAGAVLAGADNSEIRNYKKLGRYVGMIFQLTDDCMDFEATESIARKPVQSDFERNVITLPLIYAFKNLDGLKEKAKEKKLSGKDISEAVTKSKGLVYTRKVARKYYDKYMEILNSMNIAEDKKDGLEKILKKAFREF